jgi:hypothetical protein
MALIISVKDHNLAYFRSADCPVVSMASQYFSETSVSTSHTRFKIPEEYCLKAVNIRFIRVELWNVTLQIILHCIFY